MPVVPIYLNIDDRTYAGVRAGALELCGLAKNVDNKRVAKHIPAVADAAKDGAAKATDFIREHKRGTLVIGGILIVGGATAGTVGYISHRKQRKLDKQFGEALQNYLEAARNGDLTLDILNALISAIEAVEQANPNTIQCNYFIMLINRKKILVFIICQKSVKCGGRVGEQCRKFRYRSIGYSIVSFCGGIVVRQIIEGEQMQIIYICIRLEV